MGQIWMTWIFERNSQGAKEHEKDNNSGDARKWEKMKMKTKEKRSWCSHMLCSQKGSMSLDKPS